MTEKRNFTRVQFDATATVNASGTTWNTKLIDLSLKGALAQLPEKAEIKVDEVIILKLTLSDDSTEIELKGTVTHINDDHFGMVCDFIDIDSASHLRRMVELNTGSSELLNRELEALSRYN